MTKILFIPLFVAGIMGYGQVKKQVGNFSVEFPYTPTYYNEAPISGYVLDTDNVILIAGVIENMGGFDFQEFMRKSTPWEKELIEEKFYLGLINGLTKSGNLTIIDIQDSYVGDYKGKMIDSILYNKFKTLTKAALTEDGGVIFQAFLLNDSAGAYREIWTFLKSIKSN